MISDPSPPARACGADPQLPDRHIGENLVDLMILHS